MSSACLAALNALSVEFSQSQSWPREAARPGITSEVVSLGVRV